MIFEINNNNSSVTTENFEQLKLIKKIFTIKNMSNFRGKYVISKSICPIKKLTKTKIIFPRFGILHLCEVAKKKKYKKILNLDNIKIINNIKNTDDINYIFTGKLKHYQKKIIENIFDNFYNIKKENMGLCGCVLKLEAGLGKSFIAMKLINMLKKKTIIIVHNITLLNQWKKDIGDLFVNVKKGEIYGLKKKDGDIVICVINSLLKDTLFIDDNNQKSTDYFKNFGFAIFDECHEYCTKLRHKIFNKLQCKYMIGLSATPERIDNFQNLAYWGIGSLIDGNSISNLDNMKDKFKCKVKFVKYSGNPIYTQPILNKKTGMTDCANTLNLLLKDLSRKKLIAKLIKELLEQKMEIIVLGDRRDILLDIKTYMEENKILADIMTTKEEYYKIKRVVGGASNYDLEIAKKKSNVILSTYQFLGTGISIPRLNCLILLTSRRSELKLKQFCGRIFRLNAPNKEIKRIIIDIVDMRTIFKNQYYSRKKYYLSQNFEIDEIKYSYKDFL